MDLKEKENILYATVKEIKVICNRGRIRQSQISRTAFKDIQWIKFTWTWTTWSCSVVSDCLRPMDCSLPGSSVHGTFQARVLEWIAISFSKGSSQPRDWTQVFCTAGGFFTVRATREAHFIHGRKKQFPSSKNLFDIRMS